MHIEPQLRGTPAIRERRGPSAVVDDCRMAQAIASAFLDVAVERIASTRRETAPVATARHVAMYLAHVAMGHCVPLVGQAFGRDRTSVSYALHKIEDRRDDAAFDALLARMEGLAASYSALARARVRP